MKVNVEKYKGVESESNCEHVNESKSGKGFNGSYCGNGSIKVKVESR